MLQRKYKVCVVLIALLAFAGRLGAVASAPCTMMDTGSVPESAQFAMVMDHAGHTLAAEAGAPEQSCCDALQCSLLHCLSSGAALVDSLALGTPPCSTLFNAGSPVACVSADGVSLFRPPIFR